MKKIVFILALVGVSFLSVAQSPCGEALRHYAERFPQSEPTDLYKLVFQDLYGPGHLITDSSSCAAYLIKEIADMEHPERFPLYDYTLCDSNYVRVNLLLVRDGRIGLGQLISAILRSNQQGVQPSGRYVVSHSARFKEAYHPHYRIVRRDIFERELLPLIESRR